MSDTARTVYDQIVGITADNTYVILNSIFDYGKGFAGATGSLVRLVGWDEYTQATAAEELADHYEDVWRADAGSPNGTELGLNDWIGHNRSELIDALFDDSDSHIIPDDAAYAATDCVGFGRIFPQALDDIVTWVHPELADIIRSVENKEN